MARPDTSHWEHLGRAGIGELYVVAPQIVCFVPDEGATEAEEDARRALKAEQDYIRSTGRRGAVIAIYDGMVSQTSAARSVYQNEPDLRLVACCALIGGSRLGRAMVSFFLGIRRPLFPTRLFGSYEEALAWSQSMIERNGGAIRPPA